MKHKAALEVAARAGLRLAGGVAFVALLVLVVAWLAGMFGEKIGEAKVSRPLRDLPEGAETDEVVVRHKEYFAEAIGSLKAARRTEISARILATINEIRVTAGQTVQAGAPLIVLDHRDIEAQQEQARRQLEAARAVAANAQTDADRQEALNREKATSRERLEQARTDLRVARAKLSEAEQELTRVGVLLSYTTIVAPRDGMIVDRFAEPGDTARPGEALLSLYDPASLRLEVPVVEKLAVRLEVGQPLTVHVDALNQDVQATVDEIVPQAELASRSFLVKARLPRLDGLREGMAGRLRIPAGSRDHLCLNAAAIQTIGQLHFVDVVVEDRQTATPTLQKRLIKTGRFGMPGHVEVLSGLRAGDRVVLKSAGDTPTTSQENG